MTVRAAGARVAAVHAVQAAAGRREEEEEGYNEDRSIISITDVIKLIRNKWLHV